MSRDPGKRPSIASGTAQPGQTCVADIVEHEFYPAVLTRTSMASISTLLSASFGTDDGEVLVPKVSPDGRILSNREALDRYKKTGEHLGIFKDPDAADKYAELIHNKQVGFQTYRNGGKYNPSVETTNTPLEDALVKYEDAPASSKKTMEKEIYNQIILYRKRSKSIDPDDKARIDRRIAQYSNALVKRVTRDPLAGSVQ